MKETNLTRQRSADIARGLVHPSAARSLSWIEECTADGDITEGAVVVVQDDGTVTLADVAQDPRPTGVALDDMDDGEEGQVCFGGPVDLVQVTGSVTAGHYGETSTSAGEAADTTSSGSAFCYFTSSGTTPSAFLWGGRGGGIGASAPLTGADLVALGVVGPILIADDHSTPIVFGDLLLTEAGDDFLYADIGA